MVVVGIVINVISAYLKTGLDQNLSNASSWWRKKSQKRSLIRLAELDRLKNRPHEQMLLAFDEMRDRFRASMLVLFAVLLFITAVQVSKSETGVRAANVFRIMLMAFGSVSFLMGIAALRRAMNTMGLLFDATSPDQSTDQPVTSTEAK